MNELQGRKATKHGRDLATDLGVQSAKKWCKRMTERRVRQLGLTIHEAMGDGYLLWSFGYGTPAERLYEILTSCDESGSLVATTPQSIDPGSAAEFWQAVYGRPEPDVDYVFGFAAGIVSVAEAKLTRRDGLQMSIATRLAVGALRREQDRSAPRPGMSCEIDSDGCPARALVIGPGRGIECMNPECDGLDSE